MTFEQKQTLSNVLYMEYVAEFNSAKAAFRHGDHAGGVDHIRKADKINLMRLALV